MNTTFRLEPLPAGMVSAESFQAGLGVSESGFRWMIRSGRITKPIRLLDRCFWRPEDVSFYIEQRRRRLQ
jgi:hypothetical protein